MSSSGSDSGEETTSIPPTQLIEPHKFKWSVPRSAFDTPEGSKECITSKKFRAGPDNKVFWQLRLYPRGDNDARDYVGLFLGAWDVPDSVRIRNTLGFIASNGAEKKRAKLDHVYPAKSGWYAWGWPQFIKRDELLDTTKNYFREDQVTIFCDLNVHWNLKMKVPECSLRQDFSRMLESGDFSDATLIVGEEEIKAHKNVLYVGSSVFERMFKTEMKEGQTGRVAIENFDVVVIKALLSFLYTGEVKNLKTIAEKVLPAADYYAVERLKSMCGKELCDKLTVGNVADLLLLADRHSAKQLKANALAFISANAAEVVEEASFKQLADANRELFFEALRFLTVNMQNSEGQQQAKRRKLN